MPRYSLRTLLLVALIAGPLLAWGWGYVERVIEERRAALEAERARVAEEERRARVGAAVKELNRRIWEERNRRHARRPLPRDSSR